MSRENFNVYLSQAVKAVMAYLLRCGKFSTTKRRGSGEERKNRRQTTDDR
jgi:hypothetical protein